jgi:hypothetical protein
MSLSFLPLLQASAELTGLEKAALISQVVIGAFFALLVPLLLVVILQVRKLSRVVKELGEKGLDRASPMLERGRGAAENVEFVTMAVRNDVEQITTSVKGLADRLKQASERMEDRVAEFNALMDVVQSEAEDLFVGTAATVRGVRAGAHALSGGPADRAVDAATEVELRRLEPGDDEDAVGETYVTRSEPVR